MATKTLTDPHISAILNKTSIDNSARPTVFRPSFRAV